MRFVRKTMTATMMVSRGWQNGHIPPLEIGTKHQNILENMTSTVQLLDSD